MADDKIGQEVLVGVIYRHRITETSLTPVHINFRKVEDLSSRRSRIN